MNAQERNALLLLGHLLAQIRGMTSEVIDEGHGASGGVHLKRDCLSVCRAVYVLADAAYNLPRVVVDGGKSWPPLLDQVDQIMGVYAHVLAGSSSSQAARDGGTD